MKEGRIESKIMKFTLTRSSKNSERLRFTRLFGFSVHGSPGAQSHRKSRPHTELSLECLLSVRIPSDNRRLNVPYATLGEKLIGDAKILANHWLPWAWLILSNSYLSPDSSGVSQFSLSSVH